MRVLIRIVSCELEEHTEDVASFTTNTYRRLDELQAHLLMLDIGLVYADLNDDLVKQTDLDVSGTLTRLLLRFSHKVSI